MAIEAWGLYCETCQKQTMHVDSKKVNHMLHFLLGWLTCSLWWFVWLGIVLAHDQTAVCSVCGTVWKG